VLRQICSVCGAFGVDGMRADLVTARTAIALAAWAGRDVVTGEDVRTAARLALPHRRRRDPFDAPGLDEQALDDALREASSQNPTNPGNPEYPEDPGDGPPDPDDDPGGPRGRPEGADGRTTPPSPESRPPAEAPPSAPATPTAPFRARMLTVPGVGEGAPGRRSAARGPFGRAVGARIPQSRPFALHIPATVRSAAIRGAGASEPRTRRRIQLAPADLREAVREGREGNLILFAVDASGSMAARQRMRAVKGAVLSLLLDAYQRRDKVGLVTFRGTGAEVALPPTSSVEAAARRLTGLATGGRTPLAAGLAQAARVLATERLRDPRRRPLLVVVTDGRATSGSDTDLARAAAMLTNTACVVVDCESSVLRLGLAGQLAVRLQATLFRLDELEAGSGLASVARQVSRQLARGRAA
jgi:magnesium chelatase subunit D